MMSAIDSVRAMIEPALEAMGFELVRVTLIGNERPTLQVMAERADGSGMSIDDCATASRAISALLDVEDPIAGAYTLEVSSPGIDRPLTRPKDFTRFAGFQARIETRGPIDGRRRFKGRLDGLSADGGTVLMTAEEGGAVGVPLAEISRAKLILTDELIAAHGGRH